MLSNCGLLLLRYDVIYSVKVIISKVIKTIGGDEYKDHDGQPLTIQKVLINCLLAEEKDQQIDGAEKYLRYNLVNKLKRHPNTVNISSEEVIFLKPLVAKVYLIMITGQVWVALEGVIDEPEFLENDGAEVKEVVTKTVKKKKKEVE